MVKVKKLKPNTYIAPHKHTLQLLRRCCVADKGGRAAYRLYTRACILAAKQPTQLWSAV